MRASGILMHISSLPSPYGIGTFGKCAAKFIDFLRKSGQKYWQMLPLTTTGYGDSPYQSFSGHAGNPYFIDLEMLYEEGLLTLADLQPYENTVKSIFVDYGDLFSWRYEILNKAFSRFDLNRQDYLDFCQENDFWLNDYALFMVIKKQFHNQSWQHWAEPLRKRDKQTLLEFTYKTKELQFEKFMQFMFFDQFFALKKYANENGVLLIGDIPIYVAEDSVDVWCNPELFLLDGEKNLTEMAGCPADSIFENGQAWGNPIYAWSRMQSDNYAWWVRRMKVTMRLFDLIRIDHFRGFSGYFSYPVGKNPKDGSWKKGPGISLFKAINRELGDLNIIAEDLGFLDDAVKQLLQETGFPGMKVLQYAFDSDEGSEYLPHNYDRNFVAYTGTHDNDTVLGWCHTANSDEVKMAKEYFDIKSQNEYPYAFIRGAWASVADIAIAPMQDFLNLDGDARMNTPSTLGGNWQWRMQKNACSDKLAEKIYHLTKLYERLPQ